MKFVYSSFICFLLVFSLSLLIFPSLIHAQEDGGVGPGPENPGDSLGNAASDITVDQATMEYGGETGTNDCSGCSPSNTPPSLGDNPSNSSGPPWTEGDSSTDPLPPTRPWIDNPAVACSTQNQPLIEFDIFPASRADWYEVYRRDEFGNETLRRSWGAMFAKIRFVSGVLTPGVKYNYYVKAYNRDMPDWQNNPVFSVDPDTGNSWIGWLTARTDCGPGKPAPVVIQNSCNSVANPLVTLRWDQTINTGYYQVYYQEPAQPMVLAANNVPFTASGGSPPYMDFNVPRLAPSKSYRLAVVAADNFGHATWSDWTSYNLTLPCTAPVITLTLTTPPPPAPPANTYLSGGLPVAVNQNVTPVTLNWTVSNATSASTNWGQPVTLAGGAANGSFTVNTSTPGDQVFTLNAGNGVGPSTASIQLNINQYPRPYFQTTGGDVHSNESIYITP